jgi:hypothetical protein
MGLVVAATFGIVVSAQAQQPADSADVLVFSGSFTTGSREFVRVFLQNGQVYRAEVNVGAVSFRIRPRHPDRGEPPTVVQIRTDAASGESVYEIRPFQDDEYEVKVEDFPEGETATLNIYRDIRASRRRQGIVANRGGGHTSVGIEFAAGSHTNYQISPLESFNKVDRAGANVEGCLLLHPGVPGVWGCIIGVGLHNSSGTTKITWFFAEPRFRLAGGAERMRPEFGVLTRAAIATAEGNPTFVALGAYARLWLGSVPGKGLSVGVSGFHAFLFGTKADQDTFNQFTAALSYSF